MGSIILDKNKIMDFDDNYKEHLIDYCSSSGFKYIVNNEDIVLFPKLFEKTLILKSITSNEKEQELVDSIKNMLINEGSTVINYESYMNKTSLEYIDAQLFIVISFDESYEDLTIYVGSNNSENSILVVKQLIKQLIISKKIITYKIATMWNKLKEIKYWSYLFGNSTSTLILEVSNSNISKDFFSNFKDILVKSIIKELSNDSSYEKVEELILNLKLYKNQLYEQNHSYTTNEEFENIENINNTQFESVEFEEALEEVNEHIDSSIVEELKNKEDTEIKEKQSDNNKKSGSKIDDAKSKNVFLPNILIDSANQSDLDQPIQCPITYPGEGPVYEFQRPISSNQKTEESSDM